MERQVLVFVIGGLALVLMAILRLFDKVSQEVFVNIFLIIITNLLTGTGMYYYGRFKGASR